MQQNVLEDQMGPVNHPPPALKPHVIVTLALVTQLCPGAILSTPLTGLVTRALCLGSQPPGVSGQGNSTGQKVDLNSCA